MNIENCILDLAERMERVESELKGAPMSENKIKPNHYTQYQHEPIDVIIDWGLGEGFCLGNVIKYISRYRDKGGLEDLKKAQYYLNRWVQELDKTSNCENSNGVVSQETLDSLHESFIDLNGSR